MQNPNQGNYWKSGLDYLRAGQYGKLINRFFRVVKKSLFWLYYYSKLPFISKPVLGLVTLKTEHPLAYESPDHLHPHGTKDLSTRKIFVVKMTKLLKKSFPGQQLRFLDLGCAAGLLVRDFLDYGYQAVGLEGSDYNLKHRLKYWDSLGNINLFTCDITKPYEINQQFHLITAWEVMEHMPTEALNAVFSNIEKHLIPGGYFIASTSSFSDKNDGVELHLTQWPNQQWLKWIAQNRPGLVPATIPLKYYEMVRYGENSFLIYKKL